MLPGISGLDFGRQLKRDHMTRHIPMIMLTARGEEDDRVRGLESGADDYITKPFSGRELVARIRAVWRRVTPEADEETVEIHGLRLDPLSYRVTANGEFIELGPTEFRLLHFFMTHPERVYTRGQLLDRVWGSNSHVEDRTVDVYIRRLRKALATRGHDSFLQTVRGAGYRFSARH
jgi:two-component system phosphate regulon response regulator PhoB